MRTARRGEEGNDAGCRRMKGHRIPTKMQGRSFRRVRDEREGIKKAKKDLMMHNAAVLC